MFGGKKQENLPGNSTSSASAGASNIITVGTTIEGNISSSGDIRIDGKLIGELDCKGKLIIGPEGMIEGNIKCQNAVVEGRFKGKFDCNELLNVRETAVINGEINTAKLIVQSGAVYNVSCNMGRSDIKHITKEEAAAAVAS